MKTTAVIATLVIIAAAGACAADWQWPAQMSLGGFQVTDIRGTVGANGAGTASGIVQVPNLGNGKIALTRSVQGDVAGNASLDARSSAGNLRGSFSLTNSGFRGRGTVECFSRQIESPDISIDNRGEARGNGRISVGRSAVQVEFALSSSGCRISGELPLRIQVDTAVATYKFDGRLRIRSGNALAAAVSGRVERTGKLSSQVTTYNIPETTADLSNGQCTINVGGVSVTFSL